MTLFFITHCCDYCKVCLQEAPFHNEWMLHCQGFSNYMTQKSPFRGAFQVTEMDLQMKVECALIILGEEVEGSSMLTKKLRTVVTMLKAQGYVVHLNINKA